MLETTWSRKGGEGGKLPVDNSYKGRVPSGTREGAARCRKVYKVYKVYKYKGRCRKPLL